MTLTFGSLFAGIGGFDLGFERAGMQCKWQVEIDDYANGVLSRHWPNVKRFRDVTAIESGQLETVSVIAGGFPCQDISHAGTGDGLRGKRSGLWNNFRNIIEWKRPAYVVIENVRALLVRGFETVLRDLAGLGYDAEWNVFRASDFGLPHRRERLFIIAYSNQVNGEAGMGNEPNWPPPIFKTGRVKRLDVWVQAASKSYRMDDGISSGLYESRVGSLGNAVVPQIAEYIGNLIIENHNATTAKTA